MFDPQVATEVSMPWASKEVMAKCKDGRLEGLVCRSYLTKVGIGMKVFQNRGTSKSSILDMLGTTNHPLGGTPIPGTLRITITKMDLTIQVEEFYAQQEKETVVFTGNRGFNNKHDYLTNKM